MSISTPRRPADASAAEFAILKDGARRLAAATTRAMTGPHALIYSAEMRYRGQSFEIDTALDPAAIEAVTLDAMAAPSTAEHERIYGHADPHAADSGDLATPRHQRQDGEARIPASRAAARRRAADPPAPRSGSTARNARSTVYRRADLGPGPDFRRTGRRDAGRLHHRGAAGLRHPRRRIRQSAHHAGGRT